MPDPTIEILEYNDAIPEDATRVVAKIGKSSSGTAATPYAYTNPGVIADDLGDGPLVESGIEHLRTAKQKTFLIPCSTSVAASIGSVTETPAGTGPTITATGTPLDSLAVAVWITKAGAVGTAQFRYALDGAGGTFGETLDVPAKTQATLVGTVDLTGVTLATLNATTLKLDEDTTTLQTVTFTTPSSVQDIADQINAGTTNITASIVQGRYLHIVSDTLGSSSTLSCDATSTADTILGISGSATGANSSYTVPHTGITLGFPDSSNYVLDTVYTFSTTAAAPSATDITTAMQGLYDADERASLFHILFEGVDATECLAIATAVGAKLDELEGLGYSMRAIIGTPLAASDSAIKTAFQNFTHPRVIMVHGDAYERGGALTGSFRRSASWSIAKRLAKYRFSQDPGAGDLPALEGTSLVAPDTTTLARNEAKTSVKMAPHRFTTLETRIARKGAFCTRGLTMASVGSNFALVKDCRVIDRAFDIALPQLAREQNRDPDLKPDGTIAELEAKGIEESMRTALKTVLINVSPKHASAVEVTVDRTEDIGTTENLTVDLTVQLKGFFKTVTARLGAKTKIASIVEA